MAEHAEDAKFPANIAASASAVESVRVKQRGDADMRVFELTTTAPQRDNSSSHLLLTEVPGRPALHSTSPLMNALFALTVKEASDASVDFISDSAYNGGAEIPCLCFETGEKWTYVWTRDLAYALDLGLAGFDPARAKSALLFKISGFRPGTNIPTGIQSDSLQIVQDTGSGGSWPVSTDRVAWSLGAEATLAQLQGDEREKFAALALKALRGTIAADRAVAFDPITGLYGGEHSFLDWRNQSYPEWVEGDLAWLAQSKALSTNVLHVRALELAARLAREFGVDREARKYDAWSSRLRSSIAKKFWDEKAGLFSSFTSADPRAARAAKYDLLGNMLAVESGVANQRQARLILSRYPFGSYGPPVVWPQSRSVATYHNKAVWPFVSAYTFRVAADVGHVAAADDALKSLIRGNAINLSNMENLEWTTGLAYFGDGPVINSKRQLWSVGGFLGAIEQTIFGWRPEDDGIRISPFLTGYSRSLFGTGNEATIKNLSFQGHKITVRLHLPAQSLGHGIYPVVDRRLNGKSVPNMIQPHDLKAENTVEVFFGPLRPRADSIVKFEDLSPVGQGDPRVVLRQTPNAPNISLVNGKRHVGLDGASAGTFQVFRDGAPVRLLAQGETWVDPSSRPEVTQCYYVRALHNASGLDSQWSPSVCSRGTLAQTIRLDDTKRSAGTYFGRARQGGEPGGAKLSLLQIEVGQSGWYAIRFGFSNTANSAATGITAGVKTVNLRSSKGKRLSHIVSFPHLGAGNVEQNSTAAYFYLHAGFYDVDLTDYFNMSYLNSNAHYGAAGGASGPLNSPNISTIQVDLIDWKPRHAG